VTGQGIPGRETMNKQSDQAMEVATENSLNQAYLALAQEWSLWEEPLQTAVARITEFVSRSLYARRASVWLLNADHTALELIDLYDAKDGSHNREGSIARADCPVYFRAMEAGRGSFPRTTWSCAESVPCSTPP